MDVDVTAPTFYILKDSKKGHHKNEVERFPVAVRIKNELEKKTQSIITFATLAIQANGRKRCGTVDVASSSPAPNSIKRSPANRSCQSFTIMFSI